MNKAYIKNLISEIISQTAIKTFNAVGLGDKNLADQIATETIREILNQSSISGTIVIGEGEMDKAPMLYFGEKLGIATENNIDKEMECDIAVDPVDGTNICANGMDGAINAILIGEKNSIFKAPDMYMQKIASCSIHKKGVLSLSKTLTQNIQDVAKYKNKKIQDVGILMLKRDRHDSFVNEIRNLGAKVFFINDGDIASILNTHYNSNIDFYYGIGGAPEGVISAAAVLGFGGNMEGGLIFENEKQIERVNEIGISDLNKVYSAEDLVRGEAFFAISFVTNGLREGVKISNNKSTVNYMIVDVKKQQIEFISKYETYCIK